MNSKPNTLRFFQLLLLVLISASAASGQVVTSQPPFPTMEDSVIVYFHADRGNGGLAGYNGDIYAHTGVLLEESTDPGDWYYVIADWNENIPKAKLIKVEENLWKLPIGDIREYYGIPAGVDVEKLAFVFRNADGSMTGRAEGGGDLFLDVYYPGINTVLLEPEVDRTLNDPRRTPVFLDGDDTLSIRGTSVSNDTETERVSLFVNNTLTAETIEDTLTFEFHSAGYSPGMQDVSLISRDTADVADTVSFAIMVNPAVAEQQRPQGIIDGINYIDNSTVVLSLFAPYKEFVYVIGDFNDWMVDTGYLMKQEVVSEDSVHWWIELDGLQPGREYSFQYLVDGDLRIADPYTHKVLDPWNDEYISDETYPSLKPYPEGKTREIAGILQTGRTEYNWTDDDFVRPPKESLIIYELLIRDFIAAHDYATLIDTLDYLERLGVNAIELLPVTEFEGNSSWGYNPSFYFAPDKYYGPAQDLKRFIDECHDRGIAVILDMVLNHSFGQSPLVRLYSEEETGRPTPENPWYNVEARHPYNVGLDFNHNSPATKAFVKRVTEFWIEEYHFDGYRFDLSKGFTQNDTGDDVGAWGRYDASRIVILKSIADHIWSIDSTAYVILEHFAENSEERELSDYGMLLWNNMNWNYSQSAMGWLSDPDHSSDLSGAYFGDRGWDDPHLLTYMESHDEPWLMYKNVQYGRQNDDGSYNIQETKTALERIQLAATFFLTLPGPKMMWQFGELGYDEYLPESGVERTAPKPIHWEYYQQPDRRNLYEFYSTLIDLREAYPVFSDPDSDVSLVVGQGVAGRTIHVRRDTMFAAVMGNFGVNAVEVNPNFPFPGIWYEYFTGESLSVSNTSSTLTLAPGVFRIYTAHQLSTPDVDVPTSVENSFPANLPLEFTLQQNYPNPFNGTTRIRYGLPVRADVSLEVYNLAGRRVATYHERAVAPGYHSMNLNAENFASGVYIYRLSATGEDKTFRQVKKLVILK